MPRPIQKIGEVHVMSIEIRSSVEGFRRAGMAHTKAAKVHPDSTFTADQIKQLQGEPRLFVTVIDDSDKKPDSSNQSNASQGPLGGELISQLVTHIAGLDKENEALWKQDNTPKADAFPKGTTAEERTAAWEAYLASLDNGNGDNGNEE